MCSSKFRNVPKVNFLCCTGFLIIACYCSELQGAIKFYLSVQFFANEIPIGCSDIIERN